MDYALKNQAVILFDAAYEAYIKDPALPRSIYQTEGAEKCAIEFCSLSKTAGFTGTHAGGYTVVPKALAKRGTQLKRHVEKKADHQIQRRSLYSSAGRGGGFHRAGAGADKEKHKYYMQNAIAISRTFFPRGRVWHSGGENSPYIWFECPQGKSSWDFFDFLLENANVAGTPGSGFGKNGEGYFRMTAFASREKTEEACRRIGKAA